MDNIAGTPVEGENFFGRSTEVGRLADILRNDDILLLGPRRIGKTSICRAVMAHVKASNWHAIEINVASCEDELAFLEKLHSALAPEMASLGSKIKDKFAATFDAISTRIKSIKIAVTGAGTASVDLAAPASEDWIHLGNDLLRLLMQADQPWLVYIDELPIMLFNMIRNDTPGGVKRVRRFLDWFRNDVRALPGSHSVRWLVSGSVGLDTLVQQHGMADTINSLNHQHLAAFTEDVAIAMLLKLAERYQLALDNEAARKLVAAVQWAQPYYLQKAFHYLRQRVSANLSTNANTATVADIISQIEPAMNDMVQPGSDNDFHHWEQRLALQLGAAQAAHAIALLSLAAQDATGARPENMLIHLEGRMPNDSTEKQREMFINLRDILQRDAYWWPDESSGNKRYRFHLEPLRRWWLRRNSL
ncbi:ATP-binding protein [Undibacterium umbellatum]|uniref:ATP-binding protein n=1 Tax=Undibacterium umbellatum TaxID=2762300 RepID=A0ABR6ZFP6_9BURK|nr:ATP-binding protein [Undibacterium umbellatum]MBC3910553.1 ATP-binding protein [Undibacterium umbellatum]